MIGDLPELNDFFSSKPKENGKNDIQSKENNLETQGSGDGEILLYLSKDSENWTPVFFVDFAVAQIGLHVILPVQMEFTSKELSHLTLRFVKKTNSEELVLLDVPSLARWQERDSVSGRLKLGLHFHKEIKDDITLKQILAQIS